MEPFDISELNLPKVRTAAEVYDISGLNLEKTEEEKQRQRDANFLNQGVGQDTRIQSLDIQQKQRDEFGIAVPADVIESNMAEYSHTVENPFPVDSLDSPVTARRLADPEVMPVYKGSEQQTVDTEGYFKSVADRWRMGKISDSLGRLGYKQIYGTATPEEDDLVKFYEDQIKKLQPLEKRINNNSLLQEVGAWFKDIPGTIAEMTPAILSAVANSKEEALVGASAGALGMTPFSVGAGFAAGVTAGTIADVGVQEAGHAYLEFSKMTDDTGKKFNPLVVKGAAILTGTINGALEFAGEKFFAGLLGKGFSGFSKKTIKQMLNTRSGRQLFMKVGAAVGAGATMNGGEEALQQATNVVVAETIRATHGASLQGFKKDFSEVASAFSGGVKGGAGMSFGMEVGPMILTEKLVDRHVNRNTEMVKALSGVTVDSAILEKVPERYRQDVREIIAEHGAAPNIGMKHQSFSLFLEDIGITEEQLQKEMPQVYESLMDARLSQRDVKIPTDDFIEYFSQNTEIQKYYGDVRMHPGIPTDNETKEQLAKFDKMVGATIPSADNAEIHKQFADLLSQVEDPQVADYQARVLTSFFTRMKEESPELTIEEFMSDFSIDAVRQDLDNEAQANLVAKIQSGQMATDEQIYGKSLQEFMKEEGSTPESAVDAGYFDATEISQDEFNLAMESPDPVYVYGGENTKLLTERKQADDLQARAKERGVDVMQGTPEEVVQGLTGNKEIFFQTDQEEGLIAGQEGSASTQIPNIQAYRNNLNKFIKRTGKNPKNVLDYGAGKGLGAEAMQADHPEIQVDTYEPNPDNWGAKKPPTFTKNTAIKEKYDLVMLPNVLNVLPKDIRDAVVLDAISHLAPGGELIIGVRGWDGDVANTKRFEKTDEENAIIVIKKKKGVITKVFQKGFNVKELRSYLSEMVPDGYSVKPYSMGKVGAKIVNENKVDRLFQMSKAVKEYSDKHYKWDKKSEQVWEMLGLLSDFDDKIRALVKNQRATTEELAYRFKEDNSLNKVWNDKVSEAEKSLKIKIPKATKAGKVPQKSIDLLFENKNKMPKELKDFFGPLVAGHGRPNAFEINKVLGSSKELQTEIQGLQDMINDTFGLIPILEKDGGIKVESIEKRGRITTDGKNDPYKPQFGGFARSFSQTLMDYLPDELFETFRSDVTKAVEHAYSNGGNGIKGVSFMNSSIDTVANSHFTTAGAVRKAEKTVGAINLNTACPMFMIGSHGCYLDGCYVTGMGMGGNTITFYNRAAYTGEILQLSDDDIKLLNSVGGLRMNGQGDLTSRQYGQLEDIVAHAEMRGLKLKIITKQDDTLMMLQKMADEGQSIKGVQVQVSIDPYWIPISEDDLVESAARKFGSENLQGNMPPNRQSFVAKLYRDQFGRESKVEDGIVWRKYGYSVEGFKAADKKYKDVNLLPRVVVGTPEEIVHYAREYPEILQTWMHAAIRPGMISDINGKLREGDVGNFTARIAIFQDESGEWVVKAQEKSINEADVKTGDVIFAWTKKIKQAKEGIPKKKEAIEKLENKKTPLTAKQKENLPKLKASLKKMEKDLATLPAEIIRVTNRRAKDIPTSVKATYTKVQDYIRSQPDADNIFRTLSGSLEGDNSSLCCSAGADKDACNTCISNCHRGAPNWEEKPLKIENMKDIVGETVDTQNRLFQREDDARGYIDIGDKNYYKITLTGKANLTTFLHESGHMFLDVMNKMSQKKSASAGLKKDMRTLYSWLGVEEGQTSFTVEQQEQFAAGFEQYLMEGKAPSLELKSAFARFKQWFTDVYKNTRISELLTDDVRAVMDRMLASDTAIRSAATSASLAPMFSTADMAGMTEEKFNEYLESFSDAIESSEEQMRVKIMKEITRRKTAEYKEKKADITESVKSNIASRRVYQALLYLTKETLNHEGIPPEYLDKLDQKKVNEILKANPELKGNLPRGISKKKGGADPDMVAMYFGYKSAHEMLTELADVIPYDQAVKIEVGKHLEAIYGDTLKNPSALADEANKALHGDKHGKFLVKELRTLSRKNNKPLPPGFYALARSTAKGRVSQMKVGDLSSAYHFQQAEQRAGKLAIESAVKNDWQGAAEYKAQQIMNYMLYREAVKVKEEIDKTQKYLKDIQNIKKQKKLGLAGGEYLESINALLEGVDLRQKSGAEVSRRKLLSEYLAQMESSGQIVSIPDYLRIEAFLRHYSEFTAEEFFSLRDAIKNIDRLATLKLKLITERGLIDKKAAIKKIVDSIAENVKPKKARKAQDMTAWEKLKSTIRSGDADLLKVEFLFEQLDGGDVGVMHEALFQPIADAQKDFYDRMEKLGETMLKPFRDIPRDQRKRLGTRYDVMGVSMTGFNVMALALNMGNDGNFQKLIDGYNKSENRGYTRENLIEAVGNILTKEDLAVVQHIWDEVNQFWPEIEELQKKNTGIAPPKVEAVPLVLKHGTLKGGYYPVIYDRTRDFKQNENELAKGYSNDIFESNLMRKGVSKGFTETRTTYVGPIDLNVQAIGSHLNEVVFFLTHYQAIDNVNQLISSPDVRDAMANTVGVEYHTMLKEWIHSVANDAKVSDTELMVSKFANHMMVGTSIVAMGGNLSTAFTQILGLTSAVARIGLPAVMKGMTMATNPKNWKSAYAQSKELAHMMTTFDRDARKHLSKMMLEMGGGKWENVKYRHGQIVSAAFWTIGAMQQMVNVSVYLGAYNEGMKDKNMSEEQASRYADSIMRKTQSAAGAKDMARIQRDRGFGKLFTAFYSYFSSLYGLMRETAKGFSSDGVMKSMGKVMALVIIPVLLDKIMRRGLPSDDDEWEKFKKDVGTDFLLYPMASIPLARDIVSGVYGDYGYSFAPVGSSMRKLTLGVKGLLDPDKDMSRANVRNLIDSLGMVTHLPTKPFTKTDKFIEAYMNGEIEEPIQEFIFGVKR